MQQIGRTTKHTAIIGENISHSKSPAMMNAAFESKGLDYYFYIMNVERKNFPAVMREIPQKNFAGLTVTIPYKIEIMQYMDAIDPLAEVIGAVNTVKVEHGRLIGYNTDGAGFVNGLESDCGVVVEGETFFVIGAGGVSRAITTVLASRKPKVIYLESRTFEKAKALCDKINNSVNNCCVPLRQSDNLRPHIKESSVLINASFVGMSPHENETPIDPGLLHRDLLVADVIYNPPKTGLLQAAEELGCRTVNGQSLLFHQGKIAFRIWTGEEPPAEVMRQAVYK